MNLYRVEVGSLDGVEVRNIVGAVVNETGIQNRFIGQIRIHPKYSTIELPEDVPGDIIKHLRTVHVAKKPMKISRTQSNEKPEPLTPKARAKKLMKIDDFEAPSRPGSRGPVGFKAKSAGGKVTKPKPRPKRPKKPKKPSA